MISRNSVIAVCTPFTVVSRSSLMSAIITFMFEPAKLQMNCASASGRISRRADASGRSAGGDWLIGTESSVMSPPADRGRGAEPFCGRVRAYSTSVRASVPAMAAAAPARVTEDRP